VLVRAENAFRARFGREPEGIAFAPGRVNLIGEHTDYSGGFVMPLAVDLGVAVAFHSHPADTVRVWSVDYEEEDAFPAHLGLGSPVDGSEKGPGKKGDWKSYVRGIAYVLNRYGGQRGLGGAELAVAGNIPREAGLSSSAAIEVATLLALEAVSGWELQPLEEVKLAQRAENEFVGVCCGIMDQYVSRLAREEHCLRIDCRDLSALEVPLPAKDLRVIVADTGVRRKLANGEYNRRRSACERAARKLLGRADALLREVGPGELEEKRFLLTEEEHKRALHVVRENDRVERCRRALERGDYGRVGRLMCESHESLRDLYEVSCLELDIMIEIARPLEGVLGARLTGAGFGGCAVILACAGSEPQVREAIEREYPARSGRKARVFVFEAARGAYIAPSGPMR
jgi:galactokinase